MQDKCRLPLWRSEEQVEAPVVVDGRGHDEQDFNFESGLEGNTSEGK